MSQDDHYDHEDRLLATFDLKQRGWSASMIQKLLPQHDDTRENRLNRKYGRVKLYRESRVQDAETTAAYAELLEKAIVSSERAEKARATRARKRDRQLREFIEDFDPRLRPISEAEQAGLSSSPSRAYRQLWEIHELPLVQHQQKLPELGKLTREERKRVQEALKARFHRALQQAYPAFELPDWEELNP